MILTEELKKELLRRTYFETRISANPMRDGFAICLANRDRTEDEEIYLNYWIIDNKENLKRIENEIKQ